LPDFVSSPTRRRVLVGVLLLAAVILITVARRSERPTAAPVGGDFSACSRLKADQARSCYGREVGRELATVGSAGEPSVTLTAPADSTQVTFSSVDEPQPLLCELHARVGVVDDAVPPWVGWNEPQP
jgi:hypothetical protein